MHLNLSIQVDPELDSDKRIEWLKNDNNIDLDDFEEIEIECETTSEIQYDTACTTKRISVHHNNSLVILNSTEEDVGAYSCKVSTGVGSPLTVTHSYSREMDWMWLIILIAIIIAILVLVLCILCIICCRKRATKAGTYDVHPDEEDGGRQKKNSKVIFRIKYTLKMLLTFLI